MKCIKCGDEQVEVIEKDGEERYRCSEGHVKQRMVENEGLEYYREDDEVIHRSVGAVIINEGEVLLLKRRKYPYKYSIPAGHLEKGEEQDRAVAREVMEETGIEKDQEYFEKIFSGKIDDPCRRGSDVHDWNLYLLELDEKPRTTSNEEAEGLEWIKLSEISSKELTAPTEKFLVDRDLI